MIERYVIRYFLAVVDGGNFSNAARAENVTQPTLSAGIAKLEEKLGKSVFHRTNRRVHLTEAGARFLPYARRIESEFNQSIAAVQDIEPIKILRVGVLSTISARLVSKAIGVMQRKDPRIRIEMMDGSERELTSKLAQERIDFALTLVGRGSERFHEVALFEEGYAVALPKGHPFADQGAVNAEDLSDSVMIVRRQCEALSETSRFFTERGVRPFFAYRSSQDERVMAMIASGLGITIVPQSHAAPGVQKIPLNGFRQRRSIGFAFAANVDAEAMMALEGVAAFQEKLLTEQRS